MDEQEIKSIKFINVGGVDYKIKDEDLNNLVNQLIEVMQSNNSSLSRHINDLNERITALENKINEKENT